MRARQARGSGVGRLVNKRCPRCGAELSLGQRFVENWAEPGAGHYEPALLCPECCVVGDDGTPFIEDDSGYVGYVEDVPEDLRLRQMGAPRLL